MVVRVRLVAAAARLMLGDALDEVEVVRVEARGRLGGLALPPHRRRRRAVVLVRVRERRRGGVVHSGGGRSGGRLQRLQQLAAVEHVSTVVVIVLVVERDAGPRFLGREVVVVVFIDDVRLDRVERAVVVIRLPAGVALLRILVAVQVMLSSMRFFAAVVVVVRLV